MYSIVHVLYLLCVQLVMHSIVHCICIELVMCSTVNMININIVSQLSLLKGVEVKKVVIGK